MNNAELNRAIAKQLGYQVEECWGDDDVSASVAYSLLDPGEADEETINGRAFLGWDSEEKAWNHAPNFAGDLNAANALLIDMLDAGLEIEIPLCRDPAQAAREWAEMWLEWKNEPVTPPPPQATRSRSLPSPATYFVLCREKGDLQPRHAQFDAVGIQNL